MHAKNYRFGAIRLLGAARECWCDGQPVILPRRVFETLLLLIEHRDRAVGRDELAFAVWGHTQVSDAQIGQVVLRARRAVGDDGQAQQAIRTVPGFGYRWVMPLDVLETDTDSDKSVPHADQAETAAEGADRPASTSADSSASPSQPTVRSTTSTAAADSRTVREVDERQRRSIELDEGGSPHSPRRSLWLAFLLLAMLVLGIGLAWHWQTLSSPEPGHDAATLTPGSVLVLPIDVIADEGGDGPRAWIRLGVMDLIADRLRAAGLPVPLSETMLVALAALPPGSGDAELRRFRDEQGIGLLIRGRAEHRDDVWRVELRLFAEDGLERSFEDRDPDVLVAARQATDRLAADAGHSVVTATDVAEELEQRLRRVQAALLANEFAQARELIADMPESERQRPEVRHRMAQIEYRSGGIYESRRILDGLVQELDPGVDAELRGRVLRTRGSVHSRLVMDIEAEADYDEAVRLLEGVPQSAELGWALNGRGVARMILNRHDEAAADLGRGRIELARTGDRHGVVSVDNNLGLLELVRLRPTQAIAHSGAAAEQFERMGAINETAAAQSIVIEAQRSLLQWSQALAVSEHGFTLRDRLEDADYLLTQELNRARILLGLGRYRDAAGLLDGLEQRYRDASGWNLETLHATLADLHWRVGAADAAAAEALRALGARPVPAGDGGRNYTALLLQRASQAGAHVDAPAIEVAAAGADPVPARLLALAERMRDAGDTEQAGHGYRSAMAAAEARGLPIEIRLVADSYLLWLIERGRLDEASAVAGRVAPWADRDFDCALIQVRIHHARGQTEAWRAALAQAHDLAGERPIDASLLRPPAEAARAMPEKTSR